MMAKKYISKIDGFSLMELMVASVFLVVAFLAMIVGFIYCMELNDLSRNMSYATQAAKSRIETIKNTDFSQLAATHNGISFTSANLNGKGISYIDTTDPVLYKITVSFCWRQKSGRIIGEDKDLDGVLDTGEDLDGNGMIDSTVELVDYVYGG